MHPSVLAERYNRTYRPFLIGKRGSASLSHYYGMQQISKEMQGQKAVFVVSPQWFTPQGINPEQLKCTCQIHKLLSSC